MITGLPYYPLTNAGVNDAVKINADLNYLATHGMGATGIQGVTGDPGGPKGATGVAGVRGVTGLANFTEGPTMPYVLSVPHLHHHTIDDIWYTYDMDSKSWIDVSSGAKGITGPGGWTGVGLANFAIGEFPKTPSPDQPEFFWDESDEILYFWYTGAQAWMDISTGATTQRAAQNVTQGSFTGYVSWTGPQALPGSYVSIELLSSSRVMSVFQCQVPTADPNYADVTTTYMFNGVTGMVTLGSVYGNEVKKDETYVSDVLPAGSYTGYMNVSTAEYFNFTGLVTDGKITLYALDSGQGAQGVTGLYGGPPGATGVQGVTGLTVGVYGMTGVQGVTGLRGVTGLEWMRGPMTGMINFNMNGGIFRLYTGLQGMMKLPFDLNIYQWDLYCRETGVNFNVKISQSTYTGFPGVVVDNISAGGTGPYISAGCKNTGGVSGWTAANLNENDILTYNITSQGGLYTFLGDLTLRYSRR